MEEIKIAIVDDQKLFRQSLALLIGTTTHFKLVSESDGGNSFLEKLAGEKPGATDIALIDMDMPGMNGIALNKALQQNYPYIKVIILSVHDRPALITQMIDAGAAAYLAKNCDKQELITAIESVYRTGFYFDAHVLNAIRQSANHKIPVKNIDNIPIKLTQREKQVLQLICKEYSSAEIAAELFLSSRTVEGHRNNLIEKIGCRNTAGMVLFAVKYALIDPVV